MTFTNFPAGITSFGIPVVGNDIPTTSGNYWFVSSATGLSAGPGTMESPFSSIAYACSTTYNPALGANDVIVVMPGHAETVAAAGGITIATAGVQLIGLGAGASCPTITFSTSTAASVLISGAGVKIRNIVGVAGIDALTKPFDVTGGTPDLQIEWHDVSTTYQAVSAVRMTSVTNAKLDLRYLGTAGSAVCLNPVKLAGCTAVEINIDFYGTAGTAVVNTVATGASADVVVYGYMYNSGTTDGSKNFVDTVTGSTWFISVDDGAAGFPYKGGSASAPVLDSAVGVADALYGATGVVSWPGATAYANGVSVAEVLAYVQNAVRNGSGTALASNKSLQDVIGTGITGASGLTLQAALGTTGTAVADSAVSVLGAIGADNSNNAFGSTSVVADADGSVLERLEYLQVKAGSTPATFVPGLGYPVSKTENVVTATGVDLFTVTGKVLITLWTGEVTAIIGGSGTTDYKLMVKTDAIDLCATADIHGAAVGFLFQLCGDAGDSIVNTASAKDTADTNGKGLANRVVGLAGGSATLQSLRTAATTTGTIVHKLWYMPLEASASIVAA